MRQHHGLTLIEIVVVVAVLGILLAIGLVVLKTDRTAVNQAARSFAQQFPRVRIEALKNDAFAGIGVVTSGTGSYYVCVDQNGDHVCGTSEAIQTVSMGAGTYRQVRITAVSTGFTTFLFDPRGIPMGPGGTVTFSNADGTYSVNVAINAMGNATVQ